MIRITSSNESAAVRLVVEGKVAGQSVSELEKCWLLACSYRKSIVIDLSSVSFIDDLGKQLLARMHSHGTQILSKGLMGRCLIEEMKGLS